MCTERRWKVDGEKCGGGKILGEGKCFLRKGGVLRIKEVDG